MSGFKKLVQDSGIYFLSTIAGKSLLFLLGIFLTRYFTTEEFGIWNHMFSIISITAIFSSLNSGIFFVSNRFKFTNQKFREYFSGIQASIVFLSCLASLLVLSMNQWIFPKGFELDSKVSILFVIVVIMLGLRQLYDSVLQVEKKVGQGVSAQFIHSILVFILTVIFVLAIDDKWEYRFYAELLAVLCNVLVQVIYLRKFFCFNLLLSIKEYKEIYGFLGPLIFHFLGFLLINNTDKIMLGRMIGPHEVGIYGTAVLFSSILMVLYDSIIKAWQPFFFEKAEETGSESAKSLKKFIFLYYLGSILLCVTYSLVVYYIFPYIVGKEFMAAQSLIPLLCIGALFEGLRKIHANFYYLSQKTRELGIFGFTAGLMNIILNYALIRDLGVVGCVYASIASYFLLYLLTMFRSRGGIANFGNQ